MLVHADGHVVGQRGAHRRDPAADVIGEQRTGRVDDEDAGTPGVGHDLALLHQAGRVQQVRGVQVRVRRHAELAGQAEMLDPDIGLGDDGRDPGDRRAGRPGPLQVLLGADARQDRDRDLGPLDNRRRRAQQFLVGMQRPPVLQRVRAKAVAVPDRDRPHAGPVQGTGDRGDLIDGELMRDRVRPVPQRRVDYPQRRLAGHAAALPHTVPLPGPRPTS